jgi:hypothetical protein
MEKRYISTTETAALIRKQLKAKFPSVKFSVRSKSYSGGSSIDVDYTDGPGSKAVDAVIQPFCGGRFDGMIDMAYSVDSYLLPDGSAAYGRSPGTGGSRGSDPAYDFAAPEGAVLVHFSVSHVFSHRTLTKDFKAVVAAHLADKYTKRGAIFIQTFLLVLAAIVLGLGLLLFAAPWLSPEYFQWIAAQPGFEGWAWWFGPLFAALMIGGPLAGHASLISYRE